MKLKQQGEPNFTESCLPNTMELAEKFKALIKPKLKGMPKSWSFHDKVLILLLKNMQKDVHQYYALDGPAMDRIFKDFQLRHIDESLVQMLAQLIETFTLDKLLKKRVALIKQNRLRNR